MPLIAPASLRLSRSLLAFVSLLCFFALAESTAFARGYAVLVGVGRYQHPGVNPLTGPPKDVTKMEAFLRQRYGFTEFRILRDQQATKKNILAAMRWLARTAGPDEPAVFYFSGHGSRVDDQNGDEEDGLDETIVPYDVSAAPTSHIIDDEIGAWIKTVRSRKLTVLLDSCHSGTGFKSVGNIGTSKYWNNPYNKNTDASKPLTYGGNGFRAIRVRQRENPAPAHPTETPAPMEIPAPTQAPRTTGARFQFFAASLSTQSAYDVGDPTNSVFTHYLIQEAQKNDKESIQDLIKRINQQIGGRWPMTPNAEGEGGGLSEPLFFSQPRADGYYNIPPDPESSSRSCNQKGFCATLNLVNSRGTRQTRYKNGEEIRFAVQLNRPGFVFIINVPKNDEPAILFPDAYFQLLNKPNVRTYRITGRQWHLIPKEGGSSQAFFKIEGPPATEYVVLAAFEDKSSYGKMVEGIRDMIKKYRVEAPEKRIVVAQRIRQTAQRPSPSDSSVRLAITYFIVPSN